MVQNGLTARSGNVIQQWLRQWNLFTHHILGIHSERAPRGELRDHDRPEVSVPVAVHVPVPPSREAVDTRTQGRRCPVSTHGHWELARMTVKSRRAVIGEKVIGGAAKAKSRCIPLPLVQARADTPPWGSRDSAGARMHHLLLSLLNIKQCLLAFKCDTSSPLVNIGLFWYNRCDKHCCSLQTGNMLLYMERGKILQKWKL